MSVNIESQHQQRVYQVALAGQLPVAKNIKMIVDEEHAVSGRRVANVDPQQLFQALLPHEAVPAAVAKRMKNWKAGSGTFRMNVALSRLPRFSALPDPGDHLTSGIILAPSLAYMDRAYRDCVAHGWSTAPIVEMVIPSTLLESTMSASLCVPARLSRSLSG